VTNKLENSCKKWSWTNLRCGLGMCLEEVRNY